MKLILAIQNFSKFLK